MGTGPHQVLAATLTPLQPGGGGADYAHHTICPHQVLKATDAPVNWMTNQTSYFGLIKEIMLWSHEKKNIL